MRQLRCQRRAGQARNGLGVFPLRARQHDALPSADQCAARASRPMGRHTIGCAMGLAARAPSTERYVLTRDESEDLWEEMQKRFRNGTIKDAKPSRPPAVPSNSALLTDAFSSLRCAC